ncbi:Rne/Rng family ribonuclease [Aquamicrobium sp.]|uniref:Rne/Rng family ribonuclease n=1 Tax=Aquamicrobium sp. TaxID=1872579 RepID=UPI0025907EC4|nr:Rne/Rng family ribonuclease [Aquamicrobium sp.]MCK9551873.1 Rne/Rng family ribonuclease [Aquamicrobium sp.]
MPNNKMLIDASHPEETRVVVVRGNRIEEFDFESQDKKQLKGNIYLARVTRVEPSLQAAFVEYGGNRHGFLAFSEIHPDYYQIPVADRQALLAAEAEDAQAEHDDEHSGGENTSGGEHRERDRSRRNRRRGSKARDHGDEAVHAEGASQDATSDDEESDDAVAVAENAFEPVESAADENQSESEDAPQAEKVADAQDQSETSEASETVEASDDEPEDTTETDSTKPGSMAAVSEGDVISEPAPEQSVSSEDEQSASAEGDSDASSEGEQEEAGRGIIEEVSSSNGDENEVESVGAEDALEEARTRRKPMRRQYKIQEVIKRRQILLVQVVKEERGNKGAALTTYLSLAGRYSVLMPNTARGGGISRKITNAQDRKRLKEIMTDLEVPEGMGVILRTAGESRTKAEIKRDYEYLMRMWENVRNLTLQSTAPALVYEEGSLIKRSVRDLYNKDINEVLVAGEEGYREAKDFMRMLMPSHAKVVQPYRDTTPIFVRSGIEGQLDRMVQPQVTLKSGGYLIINQTEALVAIDVNSGRSTKEHSIEETALHTNLEAAEEVARQLRLRDLAGLIVIDFIDMEESRNNRTVEKRLKECLKNDRARIQVGRISHFGLLEMSRQRIRASVLESTMKPCPHCGGSGHVRSDSSVALMVVRAIEEFLLKDARNHITVRTPAATALYVLNHKRSTLIDLEKRFGVTITIEADESTASQHYVITRGAVAEKPEGFVEIHTQTGFAAEEDPEDDIIVDEDEADTEEAVSAQGEETQSDNHRDRKRRKRRRRRGGKDRDGDEQAHAAGSDAVTEAAEGDALDGEAEDGDAAADDDAEPVKAEDSQPRKRRRGKRGGRRSRNGEEDGAEIVASGDETAEDIDATASADEAEAAEQPATEAEVPAAAEVSIVTETVEAVADADEAVVAGQPEAAAAEPEAVATEPAEKPKRARRAPRAKKPKADEVAAESPAQASAPVEEAKAEPSAETPPSVAAEETAPAPQDTQSNGAADHEEAAAEAKAPAKPARTRRKPAATAEAPAAPVVSSVVPETDQAASPAEEKPKRAGWWQRKSFF